MPSRLVRGPSAIAPRHTGLRGRARGPFVVAGV